MSDFQKCQICGDWGWANSHICDPVWDGIFFEHNDEENSDDWYETRGSNAEDAALKLAVDHFADMEYPDEMEVWVKKPEDEQWTKFEITVQPVPEFTATKILTCVCGHTREQHSFFEDHDECDHCQCETGYQEV